MNSIGRRVMYRILTAVMWGSLLAAIVFLIRGQFMYAALSGGLCLAAGTIGGLIFRKPPN